MSFKNKVLIPLIITFSLFVLIISFNFYSALQSSVITRTNENLDIFTDSVLTQAMHLDLILDATTESLAQNHLAIARSIAILFDQEGADMSSAALTQLGEMLGIDEFSVADSSGVIIYSNFPDYIGFYYGSTEATAVYMGLTDGRITEFQEQPRRSVLADQTFGDLRQYTGISRAGGGFIQIGFNMSVLELLQEEINIERTIREARLSTSGYGFVIQNGKILAHPNSNMSGLDVTGEPWYEVVAVGHGFAWIDINGNLYYAGFRNMGGYTVIGLIPEADYYRDLNQAFHNTVLVFSIALVTLIVVVYMLVNRLLRPVKNVTKSLGEIATGNWDARITGNYKDEFALIKNAVNDMAANLTTYLDDKLRAERLVHDTERAKADLADFIASITSDIKTPLSVLSVNLEMLNKLILQQDDADYKRHVRVAYQKCDDLQRLIQNMLEANHIEMGRSVYNIESVSMLYLLAGAKQRYGDYMEEKNISFEITAPDDDIKIAADPQRIWSVFDNLLYNAAKYTGSGGTITINGAIDFEGKNIITITDTGCGIPPERMPHIFERSYKASCAEGGNSNSGLGLYIVKNIMEGCGGSIEVNSRPDKGTKISLAFPAN